MHHQCRAFIAVIVAATLLVGCRSETQTKEVKKVRPATVEKLESGLSRITLTEMAAKRLGIDWVEMKETDGRLEAPYSVVMYDDVGKEWVYVMLQPNVVQRAAVKVERVVRDRAHMSEGPPAGAKLVTTGIAELLGVEFGVGEK